MASQEPLLSDVPFQTRPSSAAAGTAASAPFLPPSSRTAGSLASFRAESPTLDPPGPPPTPSDTELDPPSDPLCNPQQPAQQRSVPAQAPVEMGRSALPLPWVSGGHWDLSRVGRAQGGPGALSDCGVGVGGVADAACTEQRINASPGSWSPSSPPGAGVRCWPRGGGEHASPGLYFSPILHLARRPLPFPTPGYS